MRAYPDWQLKMMDGNDVHFQYKALAGDPLYSEFWDRVTNNREEEVFPNIEAGLDLLKQGPRVIHIYQGMVKAFFKANPFYQINLKVFAKGRPEYSAIIVPINSPLKPILQFASNALVEAGIQDAIFKDWEGATVPQAGGIQQQNMVLTPGQVSLIFFVILCTGAFSILIMGCELGHKKICADFKDTGKWQMSTKFKQNLLS